jgi:hypothetical protein
MAVQYHLFNQFFEGKVMMHDIATGLIKLSDPIRDNHYQMWIVEQDDQIEIRCRIRNVGSNRFLTAEMNGQHVTVTQKRVLQDQTNMWILPERPAAEIEFITNIKSVANDHLLANNGHFIVTDANGQMWRFAIAV